MPEIGEIRSGKELGFADKSHKFMWIRCSICGEPRWAILRFGQVVWDRCLKCKCIGRACYWKGGETSRDGYVFIRNVDHPNAHSNGYVKRARLVLEQKLGRYLWPNAEPHHRNGIKDDDRPENLMELFHDEHSSISNRERQEVKV